MSIGDSHKLDRRRFLEALGTMAGATSLAGCSMFRREEDSATTVLSDDRARELAERFAPTL